MDMKPSNEPEQPSKDSIAALWNISKPIGRFNNWGERKWITAGDDKIKTVEKRLASGGFGKRAYLLARSALLTDSSGIEFVLFSDAQFPGPIEFQHNGMTLVPCFKPLIPAEGADASDERVFAMMKRGKFVYDGWIPNADWSPTSMKKLVDSLDSFVNVFSLVGRSHAAWEPKYDTRGSATPSHIGIPNDFKALLSASVVIESLPENDRDALHRSSAWITDALKDDSPVQRFLLLFVSMESLVTYIERQSSADSPLRKFAGNKLTKSERRQQREDCIAKILASDLKPTQAIQEAYFRCVVGSKAMLEAHLDRISGNKQASQLLFSSDAGSKSLWQLRNDIAHGSLNVVSEPEMNVIRQRVGALEELVRSYLRFIVSNLAGVNFFPQPRAPMFTITGAKAMGTAGTRYKGPTDMAEYYINVEGLSASYIEVGGDGGGTASIKFDL